MLDEVLVQATRDHVGEQNAGNISKFHVCESELHLGTVGAD